ncbi:Mpo1-like protein [Hydrocarboniphaga sp.]|uniref:Mpo1-like protein n=1 Tax=Hydrocarboniphaga sp. TaxID=2033016 RepID=UPI003D0E47A3
MVNTRFTSFAEFYPFYLSEHRNRTGRRLHFIGSSLSLLLLATGIFKGGGLWFVAALVCGYAFAWVGHFFFEKNRPATFRYPFYSFAGDWRMWWETLTGKRAF